MADRELKLIISGDAAGAQRAIVHTESALGKLGGALGKVSQIAGGFVLGSGIMKAPGFLFDAAKAAAEDEAATQRLRQAMLNLAETTDISDEQLGQWVADVKSAIDSGQKLAFTDDEMRNSYQQLIAATSDHEEALKRQRLAMDLARGANIPLQDASRLLGKINEENVEVFKRMGITLGDNATEADALAAVQAKFGGQSEAYAKSTAGQFAVAKIRMQEAQETIGAALLPAMTALMNVLATKVVPAIERFAEAMGRTSQWVQEWARAHREDLNAALERTKEALQAVGEALKPLGEFIAANFVPGLIAIRDALKPLLEEIFEHKAAWIALTVALGLAVAALIAVNAPIVLVVAAVVGLIAVIGYLRQNWDDVTAALGRFKEAVEGVPVLGEIIRAMIDVAVLQFERIVDTVRGVIDLVDALVHGEWGRAWEAFKNIVGVQIDFVMGLVGTIPARILAALGDMSKLLWDIGKDIFGGLLGGMKEKWEDVEGWVGGIGNKIKRLKGPIEEDRVLLEPEGLAIMEGFAAGLEDGFNRSVVPVAESAEQWLEDFFRKTRLQNRIAAMTMARPTGADALAAIDAVLRAIAAGAQVPQEYAPWLEGIGYANVAGFSGTLAGYARQQGSLPIVQNITVYTNDSPAAIANAVGMAGRELAMTMREF